MHKLLIANRGEIACRIAHSARLLGLQTVAVHTDIDAQALHTQLCDQAVLLGVEGQGPTPYLDIAKLLEAAAVSGADAVHPGYGFLSERADFAQAVLDAGLTWVGPPPEVMAALGRKDAAKALARIVGIAVVPGRELGGRDLDADSLRTAADAVGYPLLLKAAAGGGGRGMRIVQSAGELADAWETAGREAKEAFGDATLLLERYIERGRHVEVQVLGDSHGHVIHLGERDCSVQRRHQKIIEESPSTALDDTVRARMTAAAVQLCQHVGYVGAGTVEFLYDVHARSFYFLEVNTRIQVEHPVTEMRAGIDLVQWQLRIAAGESLTLTQQDIRLHGHAVEARVCAEDPLAQFLPQSGPILLWNPPHGHGIRVDHGLHARDQVPLHYDAMIAKVVAWAEDRPTALQRLATALQQTRLLGLVNNLEYLQDVLTEPDFCSGVITTQYVAEHPPEPDLAGIPDLTLVAAALFRHAAQVGKRFRNVLNRPDITVFDWEGHAVHVALLAQGSSFAWGISRQPEPLLWQLPELTGNCLVLSRDAQRIALHDGQQRWSFDVAESKETIWIQGVESAAIALREGTLLPEPRPPAISPGSVTAPGPARVIAVHVQEGDVVAAEQPLVSLEAMKMLTVLRAPVAATVAQLRVHVGEAVSAGAVVVSLTPLA